MNIEILGYWIVDRESNTTIKRGGNNKVLPKTKEEVEKWRERLQEDLDVDIYLHYKEVL